VPASIDVSRSHIALGINSNSQLPGHIAVYERLGGSPVNLRRVFSMQICTGPGEVLFNPAGDAIVIMCEGEFDPVDPVNNPDGAVGVMRLNATSGRWTAPVFVPYTGALGTQGLRGISSMTEEALRRDMEPEFGDFGSDGDTCYIVFQENNVMGVLSVERASFLRWFSFGILPSSPFDGSDRDGAINIQSWPVDFILAPDTVRVAVIDGEDYLVLTNEGDSRESEQARVKDLVLDTTVFSLTLQKDDKIGRLLVSSVPAEADLNNDGKVDRLAAYGGRSISIFSPAGELLWDSAATINFEFLLAHRLRDMHNSDRDGSPLSADDRSPDQGPEPDSLALGVVDGRHYAFVGLERAGGIVAIDITNPRDGKFAAYTRYNLEIAPERTDFVPKEETTAGVDLLVSTGERSAASNVYFVERINSERGATTGGARGRGDNQGDDGNGIDRLSDGEVAAVGVLVDLGCLLAGVLIGSAFGARRQPEKTMHGLESTA
jgi:hypothetical protein